MIFLTYRSLIEEAAIETLPTTDYERFMTFVNKFPTTNPAAYAANQTQNEVKFWHDERRFFKRTVEKVEVYKFPNVSLTDEGKRVVYGKSSVTHFDLNFGLNGIVSSASYNIVK